MTAWTAPWIVTLDDTAPALINPLTPSNNTVLTPTAFAQTWESRPDAVLYEYQSCNVNPGDVGEVCPEIKATGTYAIPARVIGAGQPNGEFWWRVRSRDEIGNWSAFGPAFHVAIDGSAPVILPDTLTTPTTNTTPNLTGTWADQGFAGVDRLEGKIMRNSDNSVIEDWTVISTTTGPFSIGAPTLAPGSYSFVLRGFDRVGNSTANVTSSFQIVSPQPQPTSTPSPTPTPTSTAQPTATPSPTPSSTASSTARRTTTGGTAAASPSPTPSPSATASPSPSPSATVLAASQSDATPEPTPEQVKGATADDTSTAWYKWLFIAIPAALLLWLLFALFRRRDEEPQF
jgi:hypothetical protein